MSANKINGEIFTAEIGGYTHDGRGVARLDGRVVFIPGALRGERVQAEIVSERRGVLTARLRDTLAPSPERQTPLCPVYADCGGCQLQHMSYAEELFFKQQQVQAALRRIGGLEDLETRQIIPAEQQYHYRNKGIFHVSRNAAGYSLSFWEENSHQPAGAACRLLFPEPVNRLLERLQQGDLPDGVSDVMVRYSFARGQLMLFLRLPEPTAAARQFLQRLNRETADLAVWGVQTAAGWQTYSDAPCLIDCLGDVQYQIAPEAFFQVNNAQTLRLLGVVEAALAGQVETLLDAYCGIGTLGIYLAKHLPDLRRLLGIELNPGAVANARQNAKLNGLNSAEFWQGRAEQEFPKLLARDRIIDTVIVDPPRKGCHQQLLAGLLRLRPPRLVYVSCNPATLARDLQLLCKEDYRLQFAQPLDLFPRTHHVETVVLMSRVKDK